MITSKSNKSFKGKTAAKKKPAKKPAKPKAKKKRGPYA